jgi:hypothetical protein
MTINILRVMVDFGLVVLIWVVQLIIYPGFKFINPNQFNHWHKRYMWLITFVVAPLMFIQAGLVGYQVAYFPGTLSILSAMVVVLIWILTFFYAVPVHNRLSLQYEIKDIKLLMRVNWPRTVLWSVLWVFSLISILYQL